MIPSAPSPRPYRRTLFDRHGPLAGEYLRAGAYAAMAGILTFAAAFLLIAGGRPSLFIIIVLSLLALVVAAAVFGFTWALSHAAGRTYQHLMMDGTSTPYQEQYSREQALVMRGRVDDALASFERVIAEQPAAVSARIRAAELYVREKRNPVRAAALLREVLRVESASTGDVVYATNRLVDLLAGPLGEPGKALVELRRFIERYPDAPATAHAREALATLRARVHDVPEAPEVSEVPAVPNASEPEQGPTTTSAT